jgi:hypothetical protein
LSPPARPPWETKGERPPCRFGTRDRLGTARPGRADAGNGSGGAVARGFGVVRHGLCRSESVKADAIWNGNFLPSAAEQNIFAAAKN